VPVVSAPANPLAASAPIPVLDSELSGTMLKDMREKRSLSIDDVSRITKIPMKFLRAIEEGTPKTLPARVYLQGFVKNLAVLYKLNPNEAAKAYLAWVDGTSTRGGEKSPSDGA
jgi:cytoskeletal protein RodZ